MRTHNPDDVADQWNACEAAGTERSHNCCICTPTSTVSCVVEMLPNCGILKTWSTIPECPRRCLVSILACLRSDSKYQQKLCFIKLNNCPIFLYSLSNTRSKISIKSVCNRWANRQTFPCSNRTIQSKFFEGNTLKIRGQCSLIERDQPTARKQEKYTYGIWNRQWDKKYEICFIFYVQNICLILQTLQNGKPSRNRKNTV